MPHSPLPPLWYCGLFSSAHPAPLPCYEVWNEPPHESWSLMSGSRSCFPAPQSALLPCHNSLWNLRLSPPVQSVLVKWLLLHESYPDTLPHLKEAHVRKAPVSVFRPSEPHRKRTPHGMPELLSRLPLSADFRPYQATTLV